MRRLLLPASLLLSAAPAAAAEWTELPLPASSGMAVYQEPATERSRHNAFVGLFAPNPRQSWFLVDYAVPHRWTIHEVRSVKQWLEFDCARTSVRTLARLYYAGPMAQGRLVASEPEGRGFVPIAPGDPEEVMHRAACAYLNKEQNAQDMAVAPPAMAPAPPQEVALPAH